MPAFYFFGEAACEERFSDLEKKQADEKGLKCLREKSGFRSDQQSYILKVKK